MSPIRGVVKWFEPAHESGWITIGSSDNQQDVKVYRNGISDPRYETLVPGEKVELELCEAHSGAKKAIGVRSLIPENGRERGEVTDFGHLLGHGHIRPDGQSELLLVKSGDIIGKKMHQQTLEVGERVEFKRESGSGEMRAKEVKRLHATCRLNRWAKMGQEKDWLSRLRGIAEKEDGDWNYFVHKSTQMYPVLKSYLRYTFKQLEDEYAYVEEGGVSSAIVTSQQEGHWLAAFNTGLETEYHVPIYALFEENNSPYPADRDVHRPEWKLKGFYRESDTLFHKAFGGSPPARATYYTDLSELLFYPDRPQSIDKEHIVKGNLRRFPEYIWKGKPEQQAEHEAIAYLDAMWVKTMRRVERNYKVAVPQYYCGQLQLLLPLYLLDGKSADLAAVVSQGIDDSDQEYYDIGTALTLDQAYNNARLLTKPDPDWLRP
jgi:cold shock CspA family protein